MNKTKIEQLARMLNGRHGTPQWRTVEWVNVQCPFALTRHDSGVDNHPSFGLNADTLHYHCFTCQSSGSIFELYEDLVDDFGSEADTQFPTLEGFLANDTGLAFTYDDPFEAPPEQESISNDYIYLFELRPNLPYLQNRGIMPDMVVKLGIRYDDEERRVVFPVYGRQKDLYGLTGRDVTGKAELKVKDYKGLKKKLNLLGIHLIDASHEFVFLCEGLFDYARLWQLGFPALCMMGTALSVEQAQLLRTLGRSVYLFTDNDGAGRQSASKAAKRLLEWVPVYRVRYPALKSGRVIKDPGEIHDADLVHYMKSRARRCLVAP